MSNFALFLKFSLFKCLVAVSDTKPICTKKLWNFETTHRSEPVLIVKWPKTACYCAFVWLFVTFCNNVTMLDYIWLFNSLYKIMIKRSETKQTQAKKKTMLHIEYIYVWVLKKLCNISTFINFNILERRILTTFS